MSAMASPRSRPLRARKPRKVKRVASSPLATSAASSADAPGTGETTIPASIAAATSLAPGSESSGVPASETSAKLSPATRRATSAGVARASLCS